MTKFGEYSWCLEALPYLDQSALFSRFDRTKPWTDSRGNQEVADANLAIFRCPSAIHKFPGKTDYGGIAGSLLPGFVIVGQDNDNGVMVETGRKRRDAVTPGEITDGASHTILVAECSDREAEWGGRWISGYNCASHNNGGINDLKGGDIHSLHPNGAYVGFADGSIQFLTTSTDEYVIGAICTRGGGELVDQR
jgi:prepilin-type processing-associated H-X9-DG protein